MRKIKVKDIVITKDGKIGIVELILPSESENHCVVFFPNKDFGMDYGVRYNDSDLILLELSVEEYEKQVKLLRSRPIELETPPSNEVYIPIPKHNVFLNIWEQFKDLAKQKGLDHELLNSEECEGFDWLQYFHGNHCNQPCQSLLEYCINSNFPDVHCASNPEVTSFGMSVFQLEPEMEFHDEEAGIVRRATEVEVFHFSEVGNLEDLEKELAEMLSVCGFLKVLVACSEGSIEAWEYKHLFTKEISSWYEINKEEQEVEYILLIPQIENQHIAWEYLVLDYKGVKINSGMI